MIKCFFFLFWQFKTSKAKEYLDNIKEDDSQSLPVLLGRGCLQFSKLDFPAAHRTFRLAFRLYGGDYPLLRYILGLCNFHLEDFDMAEKCFESYLKQDPEVKVSGYLGLALLYLKTKRYGLYREYLHKALESSSENRVFDVNLMSQLAEHYFNTGDFARSLKVAKMALQVNFNDKGLIGKVFGEEERGNRTDFVPIRDDKLHSRLLYIFGKSLNYKMDVQSIQQAHKAFLKAVQLHKGSLLGLCGVGDCV